MFGPESSHLIVLSPAQPSPAYIEVKNPQTKARSMKSMRPDFHDFSLLFPPFSHQPNTLVENNKN